MSPRPWSLVHIYNLAKSRNDRVHLIPQSRKGTESSRSLSHGSFLHKETGWRCTDSLVGGWRDPVGGPPQFGEIKEMVQGGQILSHVRHQESSRAQEKPSPAVKVLVHQVQGRSLFTQLAGLHNSISRPTSAPNQSAPPQSRSQGDSPWAPLLGHLVEEGFCWWSCTCIKLFSSFWPTLEF